MRTRFETGLSLIQIAVVVVTNVLRINYAIVRQIARVQAVRLVFAWLLVVKMGSKIKEKAMRIVAALTAVLVMPARPAL